jgi:hypothetical protein
MSPLSPAQLQALQAEIDGAVGTAANIGEVIAPQYTGFIVLGQAVAHILPSLYNDVMQLLAKSEPTPADNAALAAKIAALADPASL